MRAPGMSLNRVPILTWGTVTVSVGNLLAVPSVSLAFFFLWTDRQFGTHFFRPNSGGHPLLWQHLFWMFAHPWVYVVVLPAMGLVSDSLPFFCRRPLVGYTPVVLGTVTTMALGFGVWLHHMFATGIPFLALAFFSGASFAIAIPSAIAVFAWIATIWTGRPVMTAAFLYFAGLHRDVRDRRRFGSRHRLGARRPAGHRHLFRRRSYPLRADRHQPLRRARRVARLVPQDDRAHH